MKKLPCLSINWMIMIIVNYSVGYYQIEVEFNLAQKCQATHLFERSSYACDRRILLAACFLFHPSKAHALSTMISVWHSKLCNNTTYLSMPRRHASLPCGRVWMIITRNVIFINRVVKEIILSFSSQLLPNILRYFDNHIGFDPTWTS